MHWRERVVYYIYSADQEQMSESIASKSFEFTSFAEAKRIAQRLLFSPPPESIRKVVKVSLEMHYEFHDGYHNEWTIDYDKPHARRKMWEATL